MKVTRLRIISASEKLEPSLTGPEPCVLPLDDSPKTDVTQSKSSRFFTIVNDILLSNLPRKTAKTVKLIQSQLYSPTGAHLIRYQVRPFFASPHLNGVGGDTYEC
ncbi:hypothetical protein ES708_33722 [subsurface metagenome]